MSVGVYVCVVVSGATSVFELHCPFLHSAGRQNLRKHHKLVKMVSGCMGGWCVCAYTHVCL